MRHYQLLLVVLTIAAAGCHGSRWARSDPKYAQKYDRHTGNLLKMTKQAIDARHVEGRGGVYTSAVVSDNPVVGGAQVGAFAYPPGMKGAVETRGGLGVLVAEGETPVSIGIDLGARLQSPSRLAPFAGVGLYGGYLPSPGDFIDVLGDEPVLDDDTKFIGAIYPEVGVHYWVTPRWRLTASASHYFTTIDPQPDFTVFGLSLARLNIPKARPKPYRFEPGATTCAEPIEPYAAPTPPADKQWPSEPWQPQGTPDPVEPAQEDAGPYDQLVIPAK